MSPEELESIVRRVVREELERIEEKRSARQRKRRSREKAVMSHDVTPMSRFSQENVTLGHAPVTNSGNGNGHGVGVVTIPSLKRDISQNGSSPSSPPHTPPLTPPTLKQPYVRMNSEQAKELAKEYGDLVYQENKPFITYCKEKNKAPTVVRFKLWLENRKNDTFQAPKDISRSIQPEKPS